MLIGVSPALQLIILRGVDFKLSSIVDKVLTPKNIFDIVQALERGTRNFSKSCEGTILVDKN